MFRNMATDLLRNGKINTTDTKAKEIRRVVEKLVTLGKNGSLHARRKALGYVRDRAVVEKLFSELAQRYMERPGGYTRIVKLGYRRGDNAPISLIEMVTEEYKAKRKRRKAKPKTGTGSAPKESSKKKSAEELGLVEQEQGGTEVAEAESSGKSSKKEPKKEPDPAEQQETAESQEDEQGGAEVAEAESSRKSSKKESKKEPDPVEQQEPAESPADEQGEAEAAEAESPESEKQADSSEKAED